MGSPSLSIRIISSLVLVATLALSLFAVATALIYRNRELDNLQASLLLEAEQLQTSLGVALWYYDLSQLEKVLEGTMKDRRITGIIVKNGSIEFARSRNDKGEAIVAMPVNSENRFLDLKQSVIYKGEEVGTLQLLATSEFLNRELVLILCAFSCSILLLDLLLVAGLYGIISRIVIEPLRKLQSYAVAVSSGAIRDVELKQLTFSGEMEVLRISLADMLRQLDVRHDEMQAQVKQFRESEERFRTLVNTIPDFIWLKDKNGMFLACNKMFERLLGASEKEIIGNSDYDFMDSDQAELFRNFDMAVMANGRLSSSEEWMTYAENDEQILLDTTKTPMYDTEGRLIGVLGVARDITARKKAEEERSDLQNQLNRMQKIESVGRLAGGVAHDFNNMLGVILGHAEFALEQLSPSHPIYEDLTEIVGAATRSADLTRQLLAFARKQAIMPRVLDLNRIVDGMLKMLRRLIGEDIRVEWIAGEDLWLVKMDPSQLDQILANLCINARDAIKGVGRVSIETRNVSFGPSYCDINPEAREGDFVMLSVSDTGCGMDKEMVGQIFEPFFTTKEVGTGTGLGLATVYGVVKQNDGLINVYSEPGFGTTFKIYLPRCEDAVEDTQGESYPTKTSEHKGTILVVEDERAILTLVSKTLAKKGYSVLSANRPAEAIRLASEYDGDIDLLLVDVVMPEMNGRALAEALLISRPNLKYLFMSGYTADVIIHHGVMDKQSSFIQKPFSNSDLFKKIDGLLGGM